MNRLQLAGLMVGAVALSASAFGAGTPVLAHHGKATGGYSYTSIASPSDPTFTQLLGINKSGLIAGYFGSGADAQHPNKGFTLSGGTSYTAENYPNSAQTQVIGIDNHGDTVGFYVDSAGNTHGFSDIGGTFSTVDVPGTTFNQLLGINNNGDEVGYYQFGSDKNPIFAPYERLADGSFLVLPIANAQATSLNDHGLIGGFFNDANGNAHGFLWQSGHKHVIDVRNAVSTQVLGVNNLGMVVGSYTDSKKVTHGFIYNSSNGSIKRLDYPGSTSTVVNGINRLGWIVGFYTASNGNTIGFEAKPMGS